MTSDETFDPTMGTVGTELTMDHFLNLRTYLERQAERALEPQQAVCLLCYNFVGTRSEMYRHWLDDHGVDPALAMYGGYDR